MDGVVGARPAGISGRDFRVAPLARVARLALFLSLACGSEEGGGGGGADGGGGDGGGGDGPAAASFDLAAVEEGPFAVDIRLAIGDDRRAAVAYRVVATGTAPCAETMPPGETPASTIRVAVEGDGGFDLYDVDMTGGSTGLDVAWDGDDVLVVYQGGASGQRVCGPSDLVVARASAGFAPEILVAASGEAPSDVTYSGVGDVVGTCPAAAVVGGDLVVAYLDSHFGYTSDDFERSDLEVFRDGGPEVVDAARGGGYMNALAVAGDGRIAVAYANQSGNPTKDLAGAWLATFDGAWASERVADLATSSLGVAWDGDAPVLAFYDAGDRDLVVARPQGSGFALERVDRRQDVGRHCDLAAGGGRVAASYWFCGESSDACDPDDDALRWAVWDGASWTIEDVDRGGADERCGESTSVAFGPDGRAVIAYACHGLAGEATGRVMIAREPL